MAYYLIQATYTGDAWGTQIANPQTPLDRLRPSVESLDGTFESFFYALGEHDVVAIAEFPDNVSVGAFSVAAAAGGALKAIKTTPLMTIFEGMDMMRKAGGAGYRAPGG